MTVAWLTMEPADTVWYHTTPRGVEFLLRGPREWILDVVRRLGQLDDLPETEER